MQTLIRQMRRRVEFMEASRFWALARLWFRCKQWIGLTLNLDIPQAPDLQYFEATPADEPYAYWLAENATRPGDLERLRGLVALLPLKPSFVLMLADAGGAQFSRIAAALQAQIYPNWTLLVAGAPVASPETSDPRIVRLPPSGMPALSRFNERLNGPDGDFVAILDPNVDLAADALFEVARAAGSDSGIDVIYSDHDAMAADGRRFDPYFKPDWSPETLLGRMYFGPLVFYRRTLLAKVGGFRSGFDAATHFDTALRASEAASQIAHVPRILYHVRSDDGSAPPLPSSDANAARAIGEALARRGEPGSVAPVSGVAGCYSVRFTLSAHPRVSIVLPTRDNAGDLEICLASIFARTTYPNFQVLLIDNGSKDRKALAIIDGWAQREKDRLRVERLDVPFNFSKINNVAAGMTEGELLLFLNDDTEVLSDDWIEALVEQARRPEIGAAGGRLLYPDGTVQHAGVILGIRGIAGHAHRYFPGTAPGYHGALQTTTNYSAVTAACMMMRRTVFDEVRGFDEYLAIEFNDIDLCLRVRQAGYRIVYLPHVLLHHSESRSRGSADSLPKQTVKVREQRLMQERWNTANFVDPNYNPNLTLEAEDFSARR